MKLSKEQIEKTIKYLVDHQNVNCEQCKNQTWEVSDRVFELKAYSEKAGVPGSATPVMPVLPIICKSCGHMRFLNAIAIGLVERDEEEKT